MKKIFLLIVFSLSIICFCFPKNVNATIMELTVNIESVRVPERASVLMSDYYKSDDFLNDGIEKEFQLFQNGRIVLTDKNDNFIMRSLLYTSIPDNYGQGVLSKKSYAVLSFDYVSGAGGLSPYNIYAEVKVWKQSVGTTYFKANCSYYDLIAGGTAWYHTGWLQYYAYNGNWLIADCPVFHCLDYNCDANPAGTNGDILLHPDNVIGYNINNVVICGKNFPTQCAPTGTDSGVSAYFWRSPVLDQI